MRERDKEKKSVCERETERKSVASKIRTCTITEYCTSNVQYSRSDIMYLHANPPLNPLRLTSEAFGI